MQALCGGDRLAMLLERAFLTRDELLFKVLRNLSQQSDVASKAGFLPYMDQLVSLLQVRSFALFACPLHILAYLLYSCTFFAHSGSRGKGCNVLCSSTC